MQRILIDPINTRWNIRCLLVDSRQLLSFYLLSAKFARQYDQHGRRTRKDTVQNNRYYRQAVMITCDEDEIILIAPMSWRKSSIANCFWFSLRTEAFDKELEKFRQNTLVGDTLRLCCWTMWWSHWAVEVNRKSYHGRQQFLCMEWERPDLERSEWHRVRCRLHVNYRDQRVPRRIIRPIEKINDQGAHLTLISWYSATRRQVSIAEGVAPQRSSNLNLNR